MKLLMWVLIAGLLLLPFGASLADQTTAPGQQKKEDGAGSAKEYAPGQDKASDAQEKGEKAKAEAEKATPDVGAAKAKGAEKGAGKSKKK